MSHIKNPLLRPSFFENGNLRGIVEIPAGTNLKFELNKTTFVLEPDIRDGRPRMVDFLPYPVNYGFVPRTRMDKSRGGDGDPLDCLTIAQSLPTGTDIELLPIGLLKMTDLGELDHKVIATPADPALRTISATNFLELKGRYPGILAILRAFFLHYDGKGTTKILGFGDEKAAVREVKKWAF